MEGERSVDWDRRDEEGKGRGRLGRIGNSGRRDTLGRSSREGIDLRS